MKSAKDIQQELVTHGRLPLPEELPILWRESAHGWTVATITERFSDEARSKAAIFGSCANQLESSLGDAWRPIDRHPSEPGVYLLFCPGRPERDAIPVKYVSDLWDGDRWDNDWFGEATHWRRLPPAPAEKSDPALPPVLFGREL